MLQCLRKYKYKFWYPKEEEKMVVSLILNGLFGWSLREGGLSKSSEPDNPPGILEFNNVYDNGEMVETSLIQLVIIE